MYLFKEKKGGREKSCFELFVFFSSFPFGFYDLVCPWMCKKNNKE